VDIAIIYRINKNEGSFSWSSGEVLTFTNWAKTQPDNLNDKQHVVQLLPKGTWEDVDGMDSLKYIVEVPCVNIQQTAGFLNGSSFPAGETHLVTYEIKDDCGKESSCSFNVTVKPSLSLQVPMDVMFPCQDGINGTSVYWLSPYANSCCDNCPPPGEMIEGFDYMGRYNGHQYYYSLDKVTWQEADSIALAVGGHLVTIDDASENQLIAAFLDGRFAYIGLSDRASEGRFVWSTGETVLYQNWQRGQPNNSGGKQDHVMMLGNGFWDDIFDDQQVNFVVEIPCLEVTRIDNGPARGGVFPIGTTTITYEATDNCGNTTQNSFDIYIGDCMNEETDVCTAGASNADFFWIKQVQVGGINNYTGSDNGYKDFSYLSTTLSQEEDYMLTLTPGFANGSTDLYWSVFMDYNQDGDFYDSGEMVFTYEHDNPVQVTFQIPATSKVGMTTMRVALKFGGAPDACEMFTYGEVEDYKINIVDSRFKEDAPATNRTGQEVLILEGAYPPYTGKIDDLLPVTNQLTIDIQQLTAKNTLLNIHNSLGQSIHQQSLTTTKHQTIRLSVEHLKTGIYFISLDSGEHTPIFQKFSKL